VMFCGRFEVFWAGRHHTRLMNGAPMKRPVHSLPENRCSKKRRGEGDSLLLPRVGRTLPYLFFAVFLAGFLAVFFAAGFLATFLVVFFTAFFTATVAPLFIS
jgi:hypothetical protein